MDFEVIDDITISDNNKSKNEKNGEKKKSFVKIHPTYLISATTDMFHDIFEGKRKRSNIHTTSIHYALEYLDNSNDVKRNIQSMKALRLINSENAEFIDIENEVHEYESLYKHYKGYNINYTEKQGASLGNYSQELNLSFTNLLWMALCLGYEIIYDNNQEKIQRKVVYDMVKKESDNIKNYLNKQRIFFLMQTADKVKIRFDNVNELKSGDKIECELVVRKLPELVDIDIRRDP